MPKNLEEIISLIDDYSFSVNSNGSGNNILTTEQKFDRVVEHSSFGTYFFRKR